MWKAKQAGIQTENIQNEPSQSKAAPVNTMPTDLKATIFETALLILFHQHLNRNIFPRLWFNKSVGTQTDSEGETYFRAVAVPRTRPATPSWINMHHCHLNLLLFPHLHRGPSHLGPGDCICLHEQN